MVCWEIAWGVGGKVGRWVGVMSVVFFPGKTGRQVNPGLETVLNDGRLELRSCLGWFWGKWHCVLQEVLL